MLYCHSSSITSATLCRQHNSSRWPTSHRLARAAAPVAAAAAQEPAATTAPQPLEPSNPSQGDARPQPTSVVRGAGKVLRALCHYSPQDLSDGPASLSKVRPYNAAEVDGALQHATQQLHKLDLQQLSNIAGALAAAGHHNTAFMQQLGDAAAAQLRATPRLLQPADSLRAFRALCWLAVGFSRLGVVHPRLMEQVALYGTHLLQRSPLVFSKRKHGQQVAMLAGAFAALKLYPPQLLTALCEHIKLHKHIISLLGAQESMLLLWALARVAHKDPPVELWVTQRAVTQVGQLTCEGLAHAYSQCAEVGLTSGPLLAALRKACRGKLTSMQPAELLTLLTSLAALGQQDLLYLDEISRAVHNKLANFTPEQVSSSMAALAALRYRNPWLLERASKVLVSRKLRKAQQLTPQQLADLLGSCQQLGYSNPLLLGHLGSVAAEVQLQGCSGAELAAVVSGFERLGFYQPQLLQAAATRLLQLVLQLGARETAEAAAVASPGSGQQQQPKQCGVAGLIAAALHLVSMPSAAGSSAEKAVLPAAVLGLTAQVLSACSQHQHDATSSTSSSSSSSSSSSRSNSSRSSSRSSSSSSSGSSSSSSSSSTSSQAVVCGLQDWLSLQVALLLLVNSRLAGAAGAAPAAREQPSQLSEVTEQLAALQQQVQVQVQQQLAATVAACHDDAAAVQVLAALPRLLQCMQLVWLTQQADTGGHKQWQLGLPAAVAAAFVRQQRELLLLQQQQEQQESKRHSLQAVAAAVTRTLQAARQEQQQQQQGQQQEQEQQQELQQQQQQQQQRAVQVMHCIPGSPIVLPVAVLPGFGSTAADGACQQGVWLHVAARLQQRKLQLPAEAQELLTASLQRQRPVAVVVGARGWFTSNEPQQLLPAGQLWQQGLLAAGWDVLLLEDEEKEVDAAVADDS